MHTASHSPALPKRAARPLWPSALLELLVITFLTLLYVARFPSPIAPTTPGGIDPEPVLRLLLDPAVRLQGVEHERLSGVLLPIEIGLKRYGHIPQWNPYISEGLPVFNDAFNFAFNPFHSLPILLFGAVLGGKVGIIIALLLAGYNMWILARVIGLGGLARVTVAVLYLMSGGIAAKFRVGQFQLAASLAWPPLVLAALWWTLHSPRRLAPVALGVSFALLFYAGNIYYVLHTLIGCLVIVAAHLLDRTETRWQFRWDRLHRVLIGGAFAFGLSALQFFPIWQVRAFVDHEQQTLTFDGILSGSYSLAQALNNLTYPWSNWQVFEQPVVGQMVGVDYSYIGPAVFLLIGLGVVAALAGRATRHARAAGIALFLGVLMMVWGAGQTPLLVWLYERIPLLAEFRFLGRVLAVAAMWWILLAGIALDALWRAIPDSLTLSPAFRRRSRARLHIALLVGFLVWGYFLVYSLAQPSLRLALMLNNFRFINTFDSRRFTTLGDAASALWLILLAAWIVDTLLLVGWRIARPPAAWWKDSPFRVLTARLAAGILFALALAALADIMTVNSTLMQFERRTINYRALYAYIRQHDTSPAPTVNEPFSPLAYDAYYAEIRNWGLNEGWLPLAPPGIIPDAAGALPELPRWAIVPGVIFGDASRSFAQQFVDTQGYIPRLCDPPGSPPETCAPGVVINAVLYERPATLPYTFVVPESRLQIAATTRTSQNVFPARLLDYRQDTITIQATTPADGLTYYLVVRESNFPGWQAFVDDQPVAHTTAKTARDLRGERGYIAIPMPPGVHHYRLHYRAPGLSTGIVVFFITLIAAIAYLLPGRKSST